MRSISRLARMANRREYLTILIGVLVLFGLYLTSRHSYLLFHSLTEIFSIVVAYGIFVLTWNSRRFIDNSYILFLGIAYLFIGTIDLVHMLAYKGMGVFPEYGGNLATQLWIAARYLQSISFLAAPLFLGRKLNPLLVFFGYMVVTSLLFLSIFYWDIFPTCYVDNVGLTPFKKISEYVISFIFLASIYLLFRRRGEFDKSVFQFFVASIIVTIGSELAFTFYVGIYTSPNMIGHLLKIVAVYLIYRAIIWTGFAEPYNLLFRNLKQSEEALRASEQHYSALVKNLADGVFEIKEGVIIWCNERAEAIYGYTCEEMIGKDASFFYPTGISPSEFTRMVTKELKGKGLFHDSTKVKRKDGSLVDVEYSIAQIPDKHPFEVVAVARDITERKRVEEELRESERKYRDLVENMHEGIWVIDKDAFTVFVNARMSEMLGYTMDEMLEKHLFSFMDERGVEIAKHDLERRRQGIKERHDFEFLKKDGARLYASLATSPIMDADGNYVGALAGVQDITDLKRIEEALRESEANYRMLVESSPDGIISVDAKVRVTDCNEGICQLLGYPRAEIKGKDFRDLLAKTLPDKLAFYYDQLTRNGLVETEFELLGKNGRAIPVWAKIVGLYDAEGRLSQALVYVRDIAERKKLEQLKDEFIGLVSHELRSPLTVIMGAVNTALTEGARLSREEVRQLLQDAAWEAEYLSHILGNLLELSRARADRLILSMEPVGVKNVVRNVVDRVRRQSSTHRFELDFPRVIPIVYADQLRLERILFNLLENAVKYSPDGGKIRVFARPENDHLSYGSQ